ncbi:MAG: nitroreductase family protein [Candidatus Kaiserbacteria bacterium]|nr:nitroreductase family protein [Candidatus Kaiserbacteria bacterium]
MKRTSATAVHPQFPDRWSSRSFDGTPLSQEQRDSLFEAARFAPSSYNEQPWLFVIPNPDQFEASFSLLSEGNREWVRQAGLLCFLTTKRILEKTGEANRFFAFDAGSAWMSLALQAHHMGLSAHAMGGFDVEQSYKVLGVDKEKYEVLAAIAVGTPTPDARASEERTDRKQISEITRPCDTIEGNG